jgi:uncharacterized Zn finger protein
MGCLADHRQTVVKPQGKHCYALTSLVRCGECGRRMSRSWKAVDDMLSANSIDLKPSSQEDP